MLYFLLFISFIQTTYGDSIKLGSCPNIEPLSGFNMSKFSGKWYVIQKTATSSSCLRYEIVEKGPEKWEITEIEPHTSIVSALNHEHHSIGYLTIPDPNKPGFLKLNLPFDFGGTNFIVFMTDYDNYGAIFTCKKFPLVYRWCATIISRNETINMDIVDQIRTRIASYNIDPFTFSIVNQKKCPKPEEEGIIYKTVATSIKTVTNKIL